LYHSLRNWPAWSKLIGRCGVPQIFPPGSGIYVHVSVNEQDNDIKAIKDFN